MNVTNLLQSFVPSTARPLVPRPHLVPSIYLTCIVGSFLPPGIIRSSTVAIVVTALIAQIPRATTGDIASDVLVPIQATLVLMHWLDFYILHESSEYRRHGDSENEARKKGVWERLKWYIDLNASARGIGWDWQVKNVPELPFGMISKS